MSGELCEKRRVHGLFVGSSDRLASRLNENGSMAWRVAGGEIVRMRIVCGLYSLGLAMLVSEGRHEAADLAAHLTDGTVELLLPKGVKMEVAPGDKVVGGFSLLAYGTG